jgi:hypothetical protein
MSRYVNHKHDLRISSNPSYSVFDVTEEDLQDQIILPEGIPDIRHGYTATVDFKRYGFNQINSLNVSITTPAQQLVWKLVSVERERTITLSSSGQTLLSTYTAQYMKLRSFWENWLNANIGPKFDKWDTYSVSSSAHEQSVFFKRRKDALAFVRAIQKNLEGISID